MAQRRDENGTFYQWGEVNVAQSVAAGAASAQSAAFNANTTLITLTATVACWVALGTNPTAAAAAAGSFFVPSGIPMSFCVVKGSSFKAAAIEAVGAGTLSIVESF